MSDPIDPTNIGALPEEANAMTKELAENNKDLAEQIDQVNKVQGIDHTPYIEGLKKTHEIISSNIIANKGHALSLEDIHEKYTALPQPVAGAQDSLSNYNKVSGLTTKTTEMLGNALISAGKAFEGLSGVNYKNLFGYSDQIDKLAAGLDKAGPAGVAARLAMEKLNNIFGSRAIEAGFSSTLEYIKNTAAMADESLRAQTAMISMAGAAGNLNELWLQAGPNLNNMNSLISAQRQIINDSNAATGIDTKTLEEYWAEMGKAPGIANDVIDGLTGVGSKTNELTAYTKIGLATGRDATEMIADRNKVITSLGMKGNEALNFTTRFTELNQKLKMPIKDVHSEMMREVDIFGKFTNAGEASTKMTEGLIAIMKSYGGALEETGMSSDRARAAVGDIAGSMSQLSIAQKSFLSSQTGGPGGLLGAVEIEKMQRKGDTVGIQKKMEELLKKQFGQIVTQGDVKDQASAQIYYAQKMKLTEGTFGMKVKEDDAANVLEAMKAGTLSQALNQKDMGLNATTDKGGIKDIMAQSLAVSQSSGGTLEEMLSVLNETRSDLSIFSKEVLAASTGGITGSPTTQNTPSQNLRQEQVKQWQIARDKRAGKETNEVSNNIQHGRISRNTVQKNQEILKGDISEELKTFPLQFKSIADTLKQLFTPTIDKNKNNYNANEALKLINEAIKNIPNSDKSDKEKYTQLQYLNAKKEEANNIIKQSSERAIKAPSAPGSAKQLSERAIKAPSAPGSAKVFGSTEQFTASAQTMMDAIQKKFGNVLDINDATKNDSNNKKYEQERKMVLDSSLGKTAGKGFDVDALLSAMKQSEVTKTKLVDNKDFISKTSTVKNRAAQAPGAPKEIEDDDNVFAPPSVPKNKVFKLPGEVNLNPKSAHFGERIAETAGARVAQAPRAPVAPRTIEDNTQQASTVQVTKNIPGRFKVNVTVTEDSPKSSPSQNIQAITPAANASISGPGY